MTLRSLALGAAAAAAFAIPALTPRQADAWWVRGGFFVAPPAVVVGAPAPVYAPYPYAPAYRWVPPHYNAYGVYVPGHWGY